MEAKELFAIFINDKTTEREMKVISQKYSMDEVTRCLVYARDKEGVISPFKWAKKVLSTGTWKSITTYSGRSKNKDPDSKENRLKYLNWLPEEERNCYGHFDAESA